MRGFHRGRLISNIVRSSLVLQGGGLGSKNGWPSLHVLVSHAKWERSSTFLTWSNPPFLSSKTYNSLKFICKVVKGEEYTANRPVTCDFRSVYSEGKTNGPFKSVREQ